MNVLAARIYFKKKSTNNQKFIRCCGKIMSSPERVCIICNDAAGENLYEIYQQNGKCICDDCLESSLEYGKCFTCEQEKRKIAYTDSDLTESDDGGKFYCKKHRGNGDDGLSDDMQDYLEYVNKD